MCVDKALKKLEKKNIEEQKQNIRTPEEITRHKDTLERVFRDYHLDTGQNLSLFNDLLNWKRRD